MIRLFIVLLIIMPFLACTEDRPDDLETSDAGQSAQVIAFNPNKCMCCWGWTIQIGHETIKTTDPKLQEIIGFNVSNPIPVLIELGDRDIQCPDFYDLKSIKLQSP